MSSVSKSGIIKPKIQSLPVASDRMSFVYLERCVINRQDGAIAVLDHRGTVHIPAAALGVLMLGPGCKLTHRAMELIGDSGATVIWVGERGVRYYAHGRPLTHSSRMIAKQAALVSNSRSRLAVARQMYQMRFVDDDVSKLTMQQLRGREGARVRSTYRQVSKTTGVAWDKRVYDVDDFEGSTRINQALSAAHACLYGLAHSVIVALGASPALGFIHTGHERSFVYDIADLYKAEITIPIAFQVCAETEPDEEIGPIVRRAVRDAITDGSLIKQMVKDIRYLLLSDDNSEDVDVLHLWDDKAGHVAHGISYREHKDASMPSVDDLVIDELDLDEVME